MRTLRMIFVDLWILSTLAVLATAQDSENWKKVFKGSLPWGQGRRILLEIPANATPDADPGDYYRLRMFYGSGKTFELSDLQGIPLSDHFKFPPETIDINKYLKLVPLDCKANVQALAISNWDGPDPDTLILIAFDTNGGPLTILKKNFDFMQLEDINGDGLVDVLKSGGHGEPTGDNQASYDPYLVFRQSRKHGIPIFTLDEDLSKKWSAQNHYDWHGLGDYVSR